VLIDSGAGGDPRLVGSRHSNLRRITQKTPLIAMLQACRPLCSLSPTFHTTRRHTSAVRNLINVYAIIFFHVAFFFATEKIANAARNCDAGGIKLASSTLFYTGFTSIHRVWYASYVLL
jgi:hypothetical protein